MEGIRERYGRSLRKRVDDELDKARAEFWTKIADTINEAKS